MSLSDRLELWPRRAKTLVYPSSEAVLQHLLTVPLELPERLIIYHGGTGRTTFMAMLKITTLFLGAFFCGIVAPSYVKAEKPEWVTASSTSTSHSVIRL